MRKYFYYYCTKCGWHDLPARGWCPFCENKLKKYDCNTGEYFSLSKEEQKKIEDSLLEVIESNPEFDPELRDKRLEEKKRYSEESMKRMYSKRVEVTCPYCHSKNTRKISSASQIFNANLFGLGSPNLGKQWHCKDCGSDF